MVRWNGMVELLAYIYVADMPARYEVRLATWVANEKHQTKTSPVGNRLRTRNTALFGNHGSRIAVRLLRCGSGKRAT